MNPSELQRLIDQHYARIRRSAIGLCGDSWEADEIAQETFLIAMKQIDQFRGDSDAATWLYGICLRVSRSRYRSTIRRMKRAARRLQMNVQHDDPSTIETDELQRTLWGEVKRLPTRQREVIVLKYGEELSIKQIAAIVGCPAGTVKSRLHTATQTLQKSTRLAAWAEHRPQNSGQDTDMTNPHLPVPTTR